MKLLGRVWRSNWSVTAKLAATLHMTHYLVHPLILASLAAAPVAMPVLHRISSHALSAGLVLFALGAGAPPLLYGAAQVVLRGRGAWRRLRDLPSLAAIGTGVAVSNAAAVWEALRGRVTEFVRTPKQGARLSGSYKAAAAGGLVELACAAWAAYGALLGATGERPGLGVLLFVYCAGFAWVGSRLLWEGRRPAPRPPVESSARRWLVLLGVASLLGYAVLAAQPGSWRDRPGLFAGVGLVLGALYLAALAVVRRRPAGRSTLAWIIAVAVAMRVLALGLAPSDDVNRYIVEGVQVRGGENPYLVAPGQSSLLAELPADVRAGVNHREWSAIYPPVTLAFEAAVTSLSVRPMAFKIAVSLAEMAALGLVLLLLAHFGAPSTWLLAAAWNPVGPLFGAGEGHQDFVTAALLVLSLLLAAWGHRRLGLVGTALAALTKPFALVAAPAQGRLGERHTWLVPAAVALLAYAPFVAAGSALFRSLGRFGGELHFHGALEPVIRAAVASVVPAALVRAVTVAVLVGLWGTASALIWRHGRAHGASPAALTARLLAALLLCLPTLHPWYLAPLVVLLPFTGSWALAAWTAMAPIYWLHGLAFQSTGDWTEAPWVTALAHGPALVLLAWEATRRVPDRSAAPATLGMETEAE